MSTNHPNRQDTPVRTTQKHTAVNIVRYVDLSDDEARVTRCIGKIREALKSGPIRIPGVRWHGEDIPDVLAALDILASEVMVVER